MPMTNNEPMTPSRERTLPRLGCQTITWDPDRLGKRDHTVRSVANAGYEGIEIGAPFLDLDQPSEFKALLDACGLQLVAIHTGFNPFLQTGGGKVPPDFDKVLKFAETAQTPFIVLSGRDDREAFLATIDELDNIGRRCRDRGITLCYHNHWWEIQEEASLLGRVERETDPELVGFCPDIGWIRKVTEDVTGVLDIIKPRIKAVHLKDHVAAGVEPKDNETEFGEGILDFRSVFAYLRELPLKKLWVIAEQWKSSANGLPPETCVKRNFEFLKPFVEGTQ